MNIIYAKILILEIIVTLLILLPIVKLNMKVRQCTVALKSNNIGLRLLMKTARDIFKLSGEYVEILHNAFKEKMYSLIVLLGEMTSYSIVRRMFSKNYNNYVIGFNIARLFW